MMKIDGFEMLYGCICVNFEVEFYCSKSMLELDKPHLNQKIQGTA